MKEKDIKQVYPFPPLTEEEYEELKNDISERGVMVPIEIDEVGNIIDGYHRLTACLELGINDIPFICREGWSESEKRTQAIKLNMARRHLTQEQRRELIREQIKETPEKSDRQIASNIGVSHPTVGTIRHEMEASGDVEKFTTSTDTLGREQPRQRKAPDTNPAVPEAIDEPASSPQKDTARILNKPDPAVQNYTGNESDTEKDTYTPPRTMTPAEDLLMGLEDEAKRFHCILKMMLDDYEGNEEMKEMLFSHDGIQAALKGMSKIREVLDEYEKIVRSRE